MVNIIAMQVYWQINSVSIMQDHIRVIGLIEMMIRHHLHHPSCKDEE